MSFVNALILGIVQAITEFLPVSSSTHLKLVKTWLGVEGGVFIDLACHLGTLPALIFFLRHDIKNIFTKERKIGFRIVCATVPLIPLYFVFRPFREASSSLGASGIALMVTAGLLFTGEATSRYRKQQTSSTVRDSILIGALQSCALIPGISRSASTISCAKFLGWSPKEAVRFSFLLSIPVILAGNLKELASIRTESMNSIPFGALAVSFASSCLVSSFLVGKILPFLERGNLKPFAIYCLALGMLLLIVYRT